MGKTVWSSSKGGVEPVGPCCGSRSPAGSWSFRCGLSLPSLASWRQTTQIALDASGTATHEFFLQLARGKELSPSARSRGDELSPIELTAYAFNADRVKSVTAVHPIPVNAPEDGDKVKPRAFILSIGVSDSEARTWTLTHAAADASQVADAFDLAAI